MAYRAALLNFSKGEISPEVMARFDLPAYQAAAKRAYNVKIKRTGGLRKRPGTRFICEALSSASILMPFQFSDEQAYALEYSNLKMRPFALGGAVLETGLKVTGITKAANALVTCAFHGFSVGNQVYFQNQKGMTEINDRFLTVMSTPSANTFTVNFDSRAAGTWVGTDTGTVNSAPPPPPPTPPPTPTPAPTPTPPAVGSGGSGGYGGGGTSDDGGGGDDWQPGGTGGGSQTGYP